AEFIQGFFRLKCSIGVKPYRNIRGKFLPDVVEYPAFRIKINSAHLQFDAFISLCYFFFRLLLHELRITHPDKAVDGNRRSVDKTIPENYPLPFTYQVQEGCFNSKPDRRISIRDYLTRQCKWIGDAISRAGLKLCKAF